MNYRLKDIAKMCGGKVFGDGEREVNVLFLDSREAIETGLFVPIIGEKVDAHGFIPSVFEKACASFSMRELEGVNGDYILVNDTKKALQEFSSEHRKNFDIPFVAVTGSVGKTTTKDIIALALENQLYTLKTFGNANSQLGLPLTLLRVGERHECAVIEMGMSLIGEMEKIAYCAKPNMAVFTNVGVSHIENLGSKEKIMSEKLKVCDYFDENSILFVNGDDELLKTLKGTTTYKIIEFGMGENCDYRAKDINEKNMITYFTCVRNGEEIKMQIPAIGEHNVRNALAGLAVAEKLNLDTKTTVENIARYEATEKRQQIIRMADKTVIDDSYNSSPDSAKSSIDVLSKIEGRKIAVMADMLELGDYSAVGHKEVGQYAKAMGIDFLITFGPNSYNTHMAFGDPVRSAYFLNYEQAEEYLKNKIKKGDVILVKGSRGMKTERFVNMLKGE